MAYLQTLTNSALAKITAFIGGGPQITITQIAVGDGNGASITPDPAMTDVVNEVYRANVNQVYIDDDDNLVAELVIPMATGGFTIREIACFDSDGDMFAISQHPQIVKPLLSENAVGELVLRMVIAVSNTAAINIVASPAAVATQSWVENNFSLTALLPGGTTGQILRKVSNLDGDTEWADPTNVNVTVDAVEEVQTLTAAQTVVTFTTVTTTGLALYLDGFRLLPTQWTVDSATQVTLQNLPGPVTEGAKLHAIQNEPFSTLQTIAIGQIVMLGITSNPATIFGYGTWEQVAQGRAIFGYDVGDVDFNTLAKTGGAKTHTHAGTTNAGGDHSHGGNTGDHALTTGQIPSHSHYLIGNATGSNNLTGSNHVVKYSGDNDSMEDYRLFGSNTNPSLGQSSSTGSGNAHKHTISNSGTHTHAFTSDAANGLPPYYTVALWKRTA